MMGRNCMRKLILVMIELIIVVTLEVHANDPTPLSSAPAPAPLPTNVHPFHLDNEDITYIHLCVESTIEKCESSEFIEFCSAKELLKCLFNDPMHPKDYPILLTLAISKCYSHCFFDLRIYKINHASCIADCYEEQMKKH
jgi:hypothetical protein